MKASFTAVALFAFQICLGCSSSADQPGAKGAQSSGESTAAKPPGRNLVHGKANVNDGGEILFTLELPPGWKWQAGRADKIVSIPVTIFVRLNARELVGDKKDESPPIAARERITELAGEKALNEIAVGGKTTVRDRRIIRVGENDAVWDVVAFQPDGEKQPIRLESRCYLKLGIHELTIEGGYLDARDTRTAADFDESQADFLKISQSFRLEQSDQAPRP